MVIRCYDGEFIKTVRVCGEVVGETSRAGFHFADLDPPIRRTLFEVVGAGGVYGGRSFVVQARPSQFDGVAFAVDPDAGDVRLQLPAGGGLTLQNIYFPNSFLP